MEEEYKVIPMYDDYEILIVPPYTIRKIDDKKVCQTKISDQGYVIVIIGNLEVLLHRLIRQLSINNELSSLNSMQKSQPSKFSLDILPSNELSELKKLILDKREVINYSWRLKNKNNDDIIIYHKVGVKYRVIEPNDDNILIGSINYQYSFVKQQCLNSLFK